MTKGNQAQKLFEKAAAELKSEQYLSAKKHALKLVKLDKNNFSAWHLVAVIMGHLEEVLTAENAFNKAISLAPSLSDRAKILEQLVRFLLQFNCLDKALKHARKLREISPTRSEITHLLADIYLRNKDYENALTLFDELMLQKPDNVEALKGLARCHYSTGQIQQSVDLYEKLIINNSNDLNVVYGLNQCFIALNNFEQAEMVLLKALSSDDRNASIHYQLALLYRDFGYIEKAQLAFENALELEPEAATIYYNYSRIKKFVKGDKYIVKMQDCLNKLGSDNLTIEKTKARTELLFALGKVNDDCEHYEQAFSYWEQANRLKRSSYRYKISEDLKRLDNIKKCFNKKLFENLKVEKSSDVSPIFIVGMPRAGSTLAEQILSSHSDVNGLGELTLLPELISKIESATSVPYPRLVNKINSEQLVELQTEYLDLVANKIDRSHFTDKLPGNFWLIGMIKLAFPNAIIINAKRNLPDTCFSCFKHLFSGSQKFAYDLKELKQYYQVYEQLMTFWQELFPESIFDLEYEQLVAEPQKTVEELLKFCQLSYQEECLSFYKTKRAVKTSSAAQIRQALHGNAVGSWQRYQNQLQELSI